MSNQAVRKVAIVGAGDVGASCAYALGGGDGDRVMNQIVSAFRTSPDLTRSSLY